MHNNEERNRKRAIFALLTIGGLVGTVAFWLVSPVIFNSMRDQDQNESSHFYDELSASEDNTKAEEAYLDKVNQPDGITEMSMDDSSLALIKGAGGSDKAKIEENKSFESAPKVSTMNNLRQRVGEKLGRMMGFSTGGGGRSSAGNYDADRRRFAPGSNFKGANVATGPNARTKFSGNGKRDASFDPKSEAFASPLAKKFDGDMAKPVDPKAAAAGLGGSVPKDLTDRLPTEKPKAEIPDNAKRSREKDPCAGISEVSSKEATTQLLMGLAFGALGFAMTDTSAASTTGLNSSGGSLMQTGTKMTTDGVMGFVDPEGRIRDCRNGSRGTSSTASTGGTSK